MKRLITATVMALLTTAAFAKMEEVPDMYLCTDDGSYVTLVNKSNKTVKYVTVSWNLADDGVVVSNQWGNATNILPGEKVRVYLHGPLRGATKCGEPTIKWVY